MKVAFLLFALAVLCLFVGIVACLWVPTSISATVLGSGLWSFLGFAALGGLYLAYCAEVNK